MFKYVALFALAAWSGYCAIFPRRVWGWFASLRFKNPDDVEPSSLALVFRSIISGLVAIFLVVTGLSLLLDEREKSNCEATMSQLRDLYRSEGIPSVERRAGELGLDLDRGTEVRKDGTHYGNLDRSEVFDCDLRR